MSKNGMIGLIVAVLVVLGGVVLLMGGDDETTTNTGADDTTDTAVVDQEELNIVELAQSNTQLTTLVAAVVEAELVPTLTSEGPFTVFAPTDAAFNDLLQALDVTAEELLARDDLAQILTYHVVQGEVLAADLSDGQEIVTASGGTLTVSITGDVVSLTDANGGQATVTVADVDASNGVVHLIDAVLIPASE